MLGLDGIIHIWILFWQEHGIAVDSMEERLTTNIIAKLGWVALLSVADCPAKSKNFYGKSWLYTLHPSCKKSLGLAEIIWKNSRGL